MGGILGTMDIAKQALNLTQSQIEVTGNNIANADTPGYSRRKINVEENRPINTRPGQIGSGVNGTEVVRIFDEFVEAQYTEKLSEQGKWGALNTNLQSVEMLINENQGGRLNDVMAQFFKDWQDLSVRPDDANVRSALLGNTQSLLETMGMLSEDLEDLAGRMDDYIAQEVDDINEIIRQIADLNSQIQVSEQPGINANVARDERALKIRELSEKLDVNCIDNGGGNLTITTGGGQTLVDGGASFRLGVQGPKVSTHLTDGSDFDTDGQVYFHGSSSYEYTLKVVDGGAVDSAEDDPTRFNVSLDGGRTWLKNDDGTVRGFDATSYDNRISLPGGELEVWFGKKDDIGGVPTNDLAQGDMFTIVPKKGVYWHGGDTMTTNITSQVYVNGQSNSSRITGGSLGGYLAFRDDYVGGYQERLDALAKGLVWEVNAIHTQGSGLASFTDVTGTYSVTNDGVALGSAGSGLDFADKLQAGSLSVSIHDTNSGESVVSVLDFGGGENFDPKKHSLKEVQDAINHPDNGVDGLTATIQNNQLHLHADSGKSFSFGQDSTGLLAGLGINTYLQGSNASSLAVNSVVAGNLDYINAGQLDASGSMDSGSNVVAQDIAALQYTGVAFSTFSSETGSQTLQDYYTALVSNVGADTARSEFNLNFQQSLADDLRARQDSIAGVNLDEEMSNLIKFQQAYSAAAKLITTANQMFDTLLAMKN
ncbi:flagellar hook-associated protein FlgK [Desulfoplanes sp. PS50]